MARLVAPEATGAPEPDWLSHSECREHTTSVGRAAMLERILARGEQGHAWRIHGDRLVGDLLRIIASTEATVAALTEDRDQWKTLCNEYAARVAALTAERGARGQGQEH